MKNLFLKSLFRLTLLFNRALHLVARVFFFGDHCLLLKFADFRNKPDVRFPIIDFFSAVNSINWDLSLRIEVISMPPFARYV